MRQKFIISKEGLSNDLNIKEYAVVGKDPSKNGGIIIVQDEYALIYQENYSGEDIKPSITRGTDDLISMLRTDNMFPIGPLAVKIAESVIALYGSSEDGSTELFYDDIEQFEYN